MLPRHKLTFIPTNTRGKLQPQKTLSANTCSCHTHLLRENSPGLLHIPFQCLIKEPEEETFCKWDKRKECDGFSGVLCVCALVSNHF